MSIAPFQFLSQKQSDRLARILSVTKQMLEESGVDRLTMRQVAQASGVSPTTLYNRFGTKDKLVSVALVDHFEERIAVQLGNSHFLNAEPFDRLQEMLRLMASNSIHYRSFTVTLVNLYYKSSHDSSHDSKMTQALAGRIQQVLESIVAGFGLSDEMILKLIADELVDKLFTVHAKYCQGRISASQLYDYSLIGCVLVLLGVVDGPLHEKLEAVLFESVERIKTDQDR